MYSKSTLYLIFSTLAALTLLFLPGPSRAEILNNDEFGSIVLKDLAPIETAAGTFTVSRLTFNVPRNGNLSPGDYITIYYKGINDSYVSILDYSSDRKVKPVVLNELTKLNDGGLDRTYSNPIGDTLGRDYVLLVISSEPLSDSRLQDIATAPDKLEIKDEILAAAVNTFLVVPSHDITIDNPTGPESRPVIGNTNLFLPIEDFGIYINFPQNTYPYDPWHYMYLYPYARFVPRVYIQQYGPITWYVFPQDGQLTSNFFSYTQGDIASNGLWLIQPGGFWEGTFNFSGSDSSFYLRILPFLRENINYSDAVITINGVPVMRTEDVPSEVGSGDYRSRNPFAYYDLKSALRQGQNTLRLEWPNTETENLQLQMMDILPSSTAKDEVESVSPDQIGTAPESAGPDSVTKDNGNGNNQ
jgi:hypothetical protein